jgi:HEAT repeat protein
VRGFVACLWATWMVCAAVPARALEWPDVADGVQRDLTSEDVPVRLAAARRIASLGHGRGVPLALATLDDTDDEVRLAAADAAIRLHAVDAGDHVSAWVGTASARLRRKACEVAGAMPSTGAVVLLGRALGDPEADVREAAARALGRQASPDAVTPLLGRLDDTSPEVRVAIAAALANLRDERAVVPLVGKIGDSAAEVRQAVARALGELGDERASSRLVMALRDGNVDVRREALLALGLLRARDAVDAIASVVTDRSPSIRLAALHALAEISTADSIERLVDSLGTNDETGAGLDSTPVRDALVSVGSAAIPSLVEVLGTAKSSGVAGSAAWVLGALGAHSAAPMIVAGMRRGAVPVAFAMRGLAGAGTAAEAPVVLEFVTDPNQVTRDEALGAAMALLDADHPDGRAVEPLAAALDDLHLSAHERSLVALLLGRTGAARAAPLLLPLVSASDSELREAAIDALGALGQLGSATIDDALLDVLESSDAKMRLHAAMALSSAGGSRALTKLMADLDGADEIDRPALLTALGGVLSHQATASAVEELAATLSLSVGAERDALIESLGRAPIPAAAKALGRAARSLEPFDRRAAATMLAAHPGDASAVASARRLLDDPDASVRSQAAWSLGTIGDASDFARIEALTHAGDLDVAVNSVAALARIAKRTATPELAARWLCPLVAHPSPLARVNALSGLAAAKARCPSGAAERGALTALDDEVRLAAARAVATAATRDDVQALGRCARNDPSAVVAAWCKAPPTASHETGAVLVYVIPEGSNEPRADAAYGAVWADGLLRLGRADRRGAFFEPVAPKGLVHLVNLARPQADL